MAAPTIADVRKAMVTVLENQGKSMHLGDLRDGVIEELGLKVNRVNRDQVGPIVLLLLDGVTFVMDNAGKIELGQ